MKISWERTIERYTNCECWGGLDLSSVRDFTAWSLLFENEEDPDVIDILCRCWCPEARLYANDNKYRDQYQAWVREGWLTVTPGDAVDYNRICDDIVADADVVLLDSMNVDRLFQGAQVINNLIDAGINCLPMGMGWQSMALPMKKFEELLLKRRLNHGNNPVLRFCADNVAVSKDKAGNLSPNKAASQGKIDGIVAILLALDRYIRAEPASGGNDGSGIIY